MKKLVVFGLLATAACAAPSGSVGGAGSTSKTKSAPLEEARKSGTVTVVQTVTTVGGVATPTFAASASFVDSSASAGDGSDGPCTHRLVGDCTIDKCDVPQIANGAADAPSNDSPSRLVSAGRISVAALQKLTLVPDAAGTYGRATKNAQLFEVGGPIAIRAEGADVPAFNHTIAGPADVTITAPAWPANGAPLVIDRAKDLVFSWTGGTKGGVGVSLGTLSSRHTAQVSCKFDAAPGKATVPATALAVLLATNSGNISIDSHNMDAADLNGWHIVTNASRPARAGNALAFGRTVVR